MQQTGKKTYLGNINFEIYVARGGVFVDPQVVAIGEILVDFVPANPRSQAKTQVFEKCFGGSPMNTIVGVSRLHVSSGAIAAVGDDPFGMFLTKELRLNKVDVSQVKVKKGTRTTIAFATQESTSAKRSFLFYRKPWIGETADSALEPNDVDPDYVCKAKFLHVSGFALSQNPCRRAVFEAMNYARRNGVRISFDPTLRVNVWDSVSTLRKMYSRALRLTDIVTFSEEESRFLFGTGEPKEAARRVMKYGVGVVGIKLGKRGCCIVSKDGKIAQAPAFKVRVVDTTGAGDGWNAGLLTGLCKNWDLQKCATIANAIGALVVTKRGAIAALPHEEELAAFLNRNDVDLERSISLESIDKYGVRAR